MCSDAESKAITEHIYYIICADLRPVRLLEGRGFNMLMAHLVPGYNVACKKHFTSLLQLKYSTCKGCLRTKLEEPRSITLTTDIWTSRAMEAYITVTAHFFDSSWELNSYVLQTTAFPKCHTRVEIAAKLLDIVNDFNIGSHISVIFHDQAANMLLGWKSQLIALKTRL